jgi:hypothetical protein
VQLLFVGGNVEWVLRQLSTKKQDGENVLEWLSYALGAFRWFKRRHYRSEVIASVQAALFNTSDEALRAIRARYPNLNDLIDKQLYTGQNDETAATIILRQILVDTIPETTPDRNPRIAARLRDWLRNPENVRVKYLLPGGHGQMQPDTDTKLWNLQWSIAFVRSGSRVGKVSESAERYLISGILEALGAPERDFASSPSTTPDLFEKDFNGYETKVSLSRTDVGIVLLDAETGAQITAQRSLTQADLQSVPIEINIGTFVNLTLQDGEIVSCLITPPGNEVYGSMRAFWWALACTTVRTTYAKVIRIDTTMEEFPRIFASAISMWNIAINEARSIDNMRDLIMPMRNVHFEVINEMRDQEDDPVLQMGLDIALAMVLATQAGDPKLEAYAFRCFNRFMWLPGEEPAEFRIHAA